MPGNTQGFREITVDEFITKLLIAPGQFAFLLGAGCSKGAGVPTAKTMIEMVGSTLRRGPDWDADYAEAMDALGSVAKDFLTGLVDNKRPGLTHRELARLVNTKSAEVPYVTAIFTTNFDGLIEKELASSKRTCVAVNNDPLAQNIVNGGGINFRADRCYVVKLHGDYLLEDYQYAPWQVHALRPSYKDLLQRWCSQGKGLVIVGYRAGDFSVMRALMESADAPQGFGRGLVYVLRQGETPPEWIVSLNKLRPVPWIELLRIRDAETFFGDLRAAITNELPEPWQHDFENAAVQAKVEIELLELAATWHGQNHYQPRPFAEQVFEQFKQSKSVRGILFVDRAGAGKSILLAQLCRKTINSGEFAIWYRAAKWQVHGDLQRAIMSYLLPDVPDRFESRLREFGEILDRADVDHRAVIFIDGVNEAANPPELVTEITELLVLLKSIPRIQVVVSCREETFSRYEFAPSQFFSAPVELQPDGAPANVSYKSTTMDYRPDSYAIRLGQLEESQLAMMWATYAELHHTQPREFPKLPQHARQLARQNPLLLRLVAQAFSGQSVPEGISSLVVFRRYFDLCVEGDPPVAVSPTVKGEVRLLDLLVKLLTEELEQGIIRRNTSRDELEEKARAREIPFGAYDTLVRKGVLEEMRITEKGNTNTVPYVGFFFDRMFEFALAQQLHKKGYEARGEDLEELLQKALTSAPFWGAARVLILLELEDCIRRASGPQLGLVKATGWLTELLQEERTGVRGLVTDALVQLGEEDPELVGQLCLELLQTVQPTTRHVALAVAVQNRLTQVLLAGCRLPDRETRRMAAQGAVYLWQQDPEKGVELWKLIGERARLEVAQVMKGWPEIGRTLVRFIRQRIWNPSLDTIQETAERQAQTFVALVHVCASANATALGDKRVIRPLQEAVSAIIDDNIKNRGDMTAGLFKVVLNNLVIAAVKSADRDEPFILELAQLREDEQLREACQKIMYTWDDDNSELPLSEYVSLLSIVAQGGFLAAFALRGALIAKFRRTPEEAFQAALSLAASEDRLAKYHGITACGWVVAAASRVLRNDPPSWFKEAAIEMENYARALLSKGDLMASLYEQKFPMVDLEHVFLARELATHDLRPLVEELLGYVRARRDIPAEIQMVRSLVMLPMLGHTAPALEALKLWANEKEGPVLEALAEVLAEMLSAYPLFLEGWLESTRNHLLEHKVLEKLLRIAPDRLIFRNSAYSGVAFASEKRTSKALVPELIQLFAPAKDTEHICRIFGNLLFDIRKSPFLDQGTEEEQPLTATLA